VNGVDFRTRIVERVRNTAPTADSVIDRTKHNPKLGRLSEVLMEHFERSKAVGRDSRAIVFAQYRETIAEIENALGRLRPLVRPRRFIGQSKGSSGNDGRSKTKKKPGRPKKNHSSKDGISKSDKAALDEEERQQLKGMKQSEQQGAIREFRENKFNVLICTSIGEEGLDIGEVDLIVNYDTVHSLIRNIQRMGRTGCKRDGRMVCVIMKGDEKKQYSRSKQAEKTLARALQNPVRFRVGRNVPLLPDNGRAHRMNTETAIADGFSTSQVGGGKDLRQMSREEEADRDAEEIEFTRRGKQAIFLMHVARLHWSDVRAPRILSAHHSIRLECKLWVCVHSNFYFILL